MNPTIHTYYENIYPFSKEVLEKFKYSWERFNYEVVVHTFPEAITHPLYKEYINAVAVWPCTNWIEYTLCSLRRWLAYDKIRNDPVLLADYDVLNVSLKEFPEYKGPEAFFANALHYTTKELIHKFIYALLSVPPWKVDPKHNSDMTMMFSYFGFNPTSISPMICGYPETTSPLIHFGGIGNKKAMLCYNLS